MTNIYDRQLPELEIQTPSKVAIVGCGGVGTWVGIFTAMSGVGEIYLFDSDVIEEHNLNRLPYTYHEIGTKKTEALREYIKRIRPGCIIHCFDDVTEVTMGFFDANRPSALIACTDNIKSQLMLHNYCKKNRVRFIRVGYDGNHVTLLNHVPTWVGKKESERGGYTVVPSWVSPPAMIASLAVYSLCKKRLKITGCMDNLQAFEEGEAKRIDDNDDFRFRSYDNSNFAYANHARRRR